MKGAFLIISLLFASLFGKAQNLSFTSWLGTKPSSPNLWFRFGADTLSYSTGGSAYSPLSVYQGANGAFYIYDLSGTALCTDTGFYSYSVTGNNLFFSVTSDNCVNRKNTLTTYTWTALNTGVFSPAHALTFSVTPLVNEPGYFLVKTQETQSTINEIKIYNLFGNLVYYNEFRSPSSVIRLSDLASGVYVGIAFVDKHPVTFKIIR
ncbi:MAG: T9SS type A sorting domain-containing protein [Bacteroidetes bacterium]|nr:T9SS type A sorting domain-containing protein [Bacteroidota bacterium]